MSLTAPVGRNAERHDPVEGRGPKDEHAVTRDSAAGAQTQAKSLIPHPQCSDCGKGITTRKSNNDQFYSPEPLASNEYFERQFAAAEGSARLLSAILDYRESHEPWTLGR